MMAAIYATKDSFSHHGCLQRTCVSQRRMHAGILLVAWIWLMISTTSMSVSTPNNAGKAER